MLDADDHRFVPLPVRLEGDHVRLEPLDITHADQLYDAAPDEQTWRFMPVASPASVADTRAWIEQAVAETAAGHQVAFAIILKAGPTAVGSTRFLGIRRQDRALEIGYTWIGPRWRRTAVNTESKFLLLRHAFEALGAVRVQLKTDSRNLPSQRAVERIGARHEGVLRKSMKLWAGFVRDSVYYSILDDEWPEVKSRLIELLWSSR